MKRFGRGMSHPHQPPAPVQKTIRPIGQGGDDPGAIGRGIRPGVLTDEGVVDVSRVTDVLDGRSPQELMGQIIDEFEELRAPFEELVDTTRAVPLDIVRLRPPLPRPGKILCCIGN